MVPARFRTPRAAEVAFLAAAAALAAFMLWQALRLDLVVRGTIGPGLYPALVLGATLLASVVLAVRAARAREVRLLSPFLEGLREDTALRRLAPGVGDALGAELRVVAMTGAGRFSALHAARSAPPDGETVALVTSETAELPNFDAASFCLEHFEPVARLWFDPDVVVARADAPWRDLGDLFRDGAEAGVRVGIGHVPQGAEPLLCWLEQAGIPRTAAVPVGDGKRLLDALRERRIDVAVASLADVEEEIARGALRRLAVLGDEALPDARAATAAQQGWPMISGRWGGLALPRGTANQGRGTGKRASEALQRAFGEALRRHRPHEGEDDGIGRWSLLPAAAFARFLDALHASRVSLVPDPAAPDLPRGKVVGLAFAVAGLLLFPALMELLGFRLAAFVFLFGLMALLWPRLDARALLTIIPAAAGTALALHGLFSGVFYVVFPEGWLWGG